MLESVPGGGLFITIRVIMFGRKNQQKIISFFFVWRALVAGTQTVDPDQTYTEPRGSPPGGCYCSGPILHLIACTNISVLPAFPDEFKHGVIYIDIYQTQVTFLESFHKEDWLSLEYIDLRNNDKLPCWVVQYVIERKGLTILSDCNYTTHYANDETWLTTPALPNAYYYITRDVPDENTTVNVSSNIKWLGYFISIFTLATAASTVVKFLHKRRNDRSTKRREEEAVYMNKT